MSASFFTARDSEIQRRFGAKISLTAPPARDRQIFLVTGTGSHLTGLIKARAGQVLLGGPGWVLAELSFSDAMSLRGDRSIRTVCGVSVDPDRLETLNRLMGH